MVYLFMHGFVVFVYNCRLCVVFLVAVFGVFFWVFCGFGVVWCVMHVFVCLCVSFVRGCLTGRFWCGMVTAMSDDRRILERYSDEQGVLRRLNDFRWVGPDTVMVRLGGRLVYIVLAGEDDYGVHMIQEERRVYLGNWCRA